VGVCNDIVRAHMMSCNPSRVPMLFYDEDCRVLYVAAKVCVCVCAHVCVCVCVCAHVCVHVRACVTSSFSTLVRNYYQLL